MIEGLLLAAGESKRMGTPKMDSRLGRKTVLQLAIGAYTSSSVDDVIVVVSPRQSIGGLGSKKVRFVTNPSPSRGLSSSLKLGLRALRPDCESVVIGLGDKPLVLPSTVNALIAARRASGQRIAVPVFGGVRGNPVLFERTAFPAMMRLDGDSGAREIIRKNPDDVAEVSVADEGILLDIDSPADMVRASELMASRRSGRRGAGD